MVQKVVIGDATLYLEDCMEVLSTLPDNSVDAVVTDPPYGLSFMGKRWDYDVPSVEVWAECLRVLKPGGHLLAFAGTRTQHRMAVRIEDAGFEIRDMIAWVYGSGFPKSRNLDGDWQGWGTALKPALEPITVARKPLAGTVAENVLAHGTGAINIDGCRVVASAEDIARAAVPQTKLRPDGKDSGHALGSGEGCNGERFDMSAGRWPANLIHDGSEEVLAGFPVTGPSPKQYTKKKAGWLTPGSEHEENDLQSREYGDTGSAARFFYCAKASKQDREDGNSHPTVKPTALMRYLCRLVTPPSGVVLDPFMGSGSTGKAAVLDGFRFLGIEREQQYFDIVCKRIQNAVNQDQLFDESVNRPEQGSLLL